jgi:hypothetical protein
MEQAAQQKKRQLCAKCHKMQQKLSTLATSVAQFRTNFGPGLADTDWAC